MCISIQEIKENARGDFCGKRSGYKTKKHIYYSLVLDFIDKEKRMCFKNKNKCLLVCDIDGTLYHPQDFHPGLKEFNDFILENQENIIFVLNSGRNLTDIALVAQNGPIIRPDWLITSVGTNIYSSFSPLSFDDEWIKQSEKPWPRDEIENVLKSCKNLEMQELEHQDPGKLAYYSTVSLGSILPTILSLVEPWKKEIKIISSFDYYLDIVPPWGGKGGAIKFLAQKLSIPFSQVIVAGDSGNDLDMLDNEFKSIVVSNYTPELEGFVKKGKAFCASKPAALGVLEGLAYYGLR